MHRLFHCAQRPIQVTWFFGRGASVHHGGAVFEPEVISVSRVEMDFDFFISVLGMVLIVEGLPYFAFPNRIKAFLVSILEAPESLLRAAGFMAMVLGLILVYLGRS